MKIDEIDVIDFVKFLLNQLSRKETEEIRDYLDVRLKARDSYFLKRNIIEVLTEGREAQSEAYKRRNFSSLVKHIEKYESERIITVNDFMNIPEGEILRWRNVGRKSLKTVLEYLESQQLKAVQNKEIK